MSLLMSKIITIDSTKEWSQRSFRLLTLTFMTLARSSFYLWKVTNLFATTRIMSVTLPIQMPNGVGFHFSQIDVLEKLKTPMKQVWYPLKCQYIRSWKVSSPSIGQNLMHGRRNLQKRAICITSSSELTFISAETYQLLTQTELQTLTYKFGTCQI